MLGMLASGLGKQTATFGAGLCFLPAASVEIPAERVLVFVRLCLQQGISCLLELLE